MTATKLGGTTIFGGSARSAILVVFVLAAHWAVYNAIQYTLYYLAPHLFRPFQFRVLLVGLIEFAAVYNGPKNSDSGLR